MYPITHLGYSLSALHWKKAAEEDGGKNGIYLMVWLSSVTGRRESCHWWAADTFLRLEAVGNRNESLDWNVAMSG